MASLEDFTNTQTPGLDDFVSSTSSVAPVVNGASNLNIATHAAALSADPENAVNYYRQVDSELTMEGKSDAADRLFQMAKQQQFEKARSGLVNVLLDPSVPDDMKRNAGLAVLDANNEMYNPRNILSSQALEEPSRGESVEQEVVRVNLGQQINAINDYKRKSQEVLNREVAASDPSTVKAFANIFEMFTPFMEQKFAGSVLSDLQDGKSSAYGKALGLLGNAKVDIHSMLKGLPVDQRMDMTQRIVDAINANSSIVMPDTNDYARVQYLRDTLEQGSYSDVDQWVDNAASVLDLAGLGGLARRGVGALKGLRGAGLAESAERDIVRQAQRSQVQPTTVSQNYKDTNPSKAQGTHEMMASDESGEAANALYGTTRTDAIANDIAPEIGGVEGAVRNKVGRPGQIHDDSITPNADVMDFVKDRGDIYYDKAEKIKTRAAVVNDFQSANGLVARTEMFNIENLADGVGVKAIYGPPQGGFSNAKEARDMATWALRDYGVPDEAVSLLKRDGSNYVPVSNEELDAVLSKDIIRGGPNGVERVEPDYLIQVDHKYQFSPADVTEWANFDVKYNIFDRVFANYNGPSLQSMGAGSLQRHLVDAASMFRPEVTKGASVAVDRSAALEQRLLEIGDDFAKTATSLPKDRQVALETVIREANEQGIDLDYSKLMADGFRPKEIDALKSWREFWDTTYHLENADLAKTLRNRGYMEFIDHENDTKLFAKPLNKGTVTSAFGNSAKVYDHTEGSIRHMGKVEIEELYAKQGQLAQLRSPVRVGDEAAELIVNRNQPGKAYMRALSDSSEVLSYRKGYYSVNYTDPHFIVKKVKDSKGNLLYEKAVATAKTKKEADLLTARMAATDGEEYYNRHDLKGTSTSSDSHWDIMSARGRTAQRTRGQRLEDATSSVDPRQANIMSPVDALVHSARSISRRTELRDYLDATKLRAMSQYEEYFPKGKFNDVQFPSKVSDIQYRGGDAPNAKKLADARSTFEYIKYMEDGYINSIDDLYKNTFKFLAEVAGNRHFSSAEKALRWMGDTKGPAGMAKALSFNLYLALNPLRQAIIQGHQSVQLFAANPTYFLKGRFVPQMTALTAMDLGIPVSKSTINGSGWSEELMRKVHQDFRDSGLAAAIDKQNLVRGSLLNLADQTAMSQARRALSKPLTWARKIGFDAGEYVNTLSSYLSFYDQAFRRGDDIYSKEVLENIAADSRNFTYNMNAAGDLPYNQNALSVVFQFMQVPHKAMLTMTTNRSLTAMQKVRLASFNSLMYTLPPAAMYNIFGNMLPDDPTARDVVVQGLEGAMFNKLLSLSTGEKTNIDFSGLAPLDMYGTYEFIHGLFSQDVGAIVAASPSGALLFGNNPRLTEFAKVGARYFNLVDDYESPTQFSQVANEFAKLSSGYSNAFKAAYALKYKQKINTMGGITDSSVTSAEAVAQAFGFPTMDETMRYYVTDKSYKASEAFKQDVKKWYGDYKKQLVREGITPAELEGINRVYTEAWRHWGNDNFEAKSQISTLLQQDVANGDARIYNSVMRLTGIQSAEKTKALLKALPNIEDDKRQQAIDSVDFIQTYKDPN